MSFLPVSLRHFGFALTDGARPYEVVKVRCGDHEVEITVSPAGRKWHVHIDGEKVR